MENFFYENEFYLHDDKNNFHKKGFARGLVLKQRLAASRKWPILLEVFQHRLLFHLSVTMIVTIMPTFKVAMQTSANTVSLALWSCLKLIPCKGTEIQVR